MTYVPGNAYREIALGGGAANYPAGAAAGTDALYASGANPIANQGAVFGAFYFDPAAHKASKVRVTLGVLANTVAPGGNWTATLKKILTWGGASGSRPQIATTADICTATITGAVAGPNGAIGADVAVPTAGWFVLTITRSAAVAAGSVVEANATMQFRGE